MKVIYNINVAFVLVLCMLLLQFQTNGQDRFQEGQALSPAQLKAAMQLKSDLIEQKNSQPTQLPWSVNCPNNIIVESDVDKTSAAISIANPMQIDAGAVVSYSNSFNCSTDASDRYPIGTTVVKWTASDDKGNVHRCNFTVTVTNNCCVIVSDEVDPEPATCLFPRPAQMQIEEQIIVDYAAYDSIDVDQTYGFIYNIHQDFEPEDYIVFGTPNGIDSTNVKFRNATVAYRWLNDTFNEDSVTIPHQTTTTTIDSIFYLFYHQNGSGLMNTIRTRIITLTATGFPNYNNVIWQNTIETDSSLSVTEFLDLEVLQVDEALTTGQRFAVVIDFYGGDKSQDYFYLFNTYNIECPFDQNITQSNYSAFYPNSHYHISTTAGQGTVFDGLFPSEANDFLGFDHDGDGNRGEDESCEAFFVQNWHIGAFLTLDANFTADTYATLDTICPSGFTELNSNVFFGEGPYTYEWTPATALTQVNSASTSAAPNQTTTYTLTVNDATGSTATSSITVYVDPISIDLGPDQGVDCDNTAQIIPMITNPFGGMLDFQWSNGLTDQIVNLTAGNYSLTISNDNCSATDDVLISLLNSNLVAAFTHENISPATIQFTNNSVNADSYLWDFGDGTPTSIEEDPIHTYSINNDFLVTLQAFAGSCTVATFETVVINIATGVEVNESLGSVLYYPNPAKEKLLIETDLFDRGATFELIDVTGKVVKQTSSVNQKGLIEWDLNGLAAGVYFLSVSGEQFQYTDKVLIEK